MNEIPCAETAPQPVIQPETWEADTARIRHDVGSIKILLIIMMIIGTACTVAALIIQAKAESDLHTLIQGNSQQLNGYCVMGSC